jgi:ribonuclease P protein subunit RPR2
MKSKPGVPNKHLYSRVSYLCQAANYLDLAHRGLKTNDNSLVSSGSSRQMIAHLQNVALKSQLRVSSSVKHSFCKLCHVILREGSTLSSYIENNSRGGKKPWADVLVHECTQCGAKKRFPVGAKRQARRIKRETKGQEEVIKTQMT